tara:strand:- start:600 stop:710 length:111 start_codon:yes stop_codon:yes gene_type:complete
LAKAAYQAKETVVLQQAPASEVLALVLQGLAPELDQ